MSRETSNDLAWLDLEMTGLDPKFNVIIEIATVVTDFNLQIIAEGPNLIIHQPEERMANMDEWNTRQHGLSGLTEAVRKSTVTTEEAEQKTLEFLSTYLQTGKSPLCGNSICTDRRFLCEHMPALERFFNYRLIDVSSVKELSRRWHPDLLPKKRTPNGHRALADVLASIQELRLYRDHFFICQ